MTGTVAVERPSYMVSAPITEGLDNLGRVQGGPFKQAFFTHFQPVFLIAVIGFYYYAPAAWIKPSVTLWIGLIVKFMMLGMEWISPRYKSWEHTWKELVCDTFYVAMGMMIVRVVFGPINSDAIIGWFQDNFDIAKFAWFIGAPLLVQAFLISFIGDYFQYWMHRGMHNWYPLWVAHAPHHYLTQLNVQKGSVGNPVEIFLIGLGVGGMFDFLPRAALLAGAFGLAVSSYQHCNIRFNTPKWWFKIFNTTEHHSLHHAQDYESTRSNYSGTWIFIDRIHGTCKDGEAELLGQEGGRRMSVWETLHYTFTEPYKLLRAKFARRGSQPPMVAVPAE